MWFRKPIVSEDMAAWIAECFEWFDVRFPSPEGPILPTKQFFRAGRGKDDTAARAVLQDVKRLLHFDQPIEITAHHSIPVEHRHTYQSTSDVAGTYREAEDGRLITYDPTLMERPLMFIDTLAHEVMHARLAGLEDRVPGGTGAHELVTDLGCIIAGFGAIQMQAADDAGWKGYLSQDSRAFALALFLQRRGLDETAVKAHLSNRCQKVLTKGFRSLTIFD
jgi:hypothetical protein